MFQLPSSHIQSMLQFQAIQFMMCLGAGDFNYQTRDLKNGVYRGKKSVAEKVDLRTFSKKAPAVSQISTYTEPNILTGNPSVRTDSGRRELRQQTILNASQTQSSGIHNTHKRTVTVEEIFKSYKLPDISGSQWTNWRDPGSRVRSYDVPLLLPPSPAEPHAEIYILA